MSFAIFIRVAASVATAPAREHDRVVGGEGRELVRARVTNGRPVSSAIFAAHASANPSGAFSPVPTAVPPIGELVQAGQRGSIRARSASSWAT